MSSSFEGEKCLLGNGVGVTCADDKNKSGQLAGGRKVEGRLSENFRFPSDVATIFIYNHQWMGKSMKVVRAGLSRANKGRFC